MKFNSGIAAVIVLSFSVAGLAACDKGPAERAGEKIDNAAEKVGDKVEDVGDKVKDAAKDATK
jgi:hyperosmotically inducible protein